MFSSNLPSAICHLQSFSGVLQSFFHLAATSPGRQRTFRRVAATHLLAMAGCALGMRWSEAVPAAVLLGNVLLVAGIVEGALLIGWRLAQLPKSQALEFLLVSPIRPPLVLTAEALVGLGRLGLVTIAGLPVLGLMVLEGVILPEDIGTLLLMPFTWGAVTGLGLTVWAYESAGVRRWGERLMLLAVVVYLIIGILAGEHLRQWVGLLPSGIGEAFLTSFEALHRYNPFSVMRFAMEQNPSWPGSKSCGWSWAAWLCSCSCWRARPGVCTHIFRSGITGRLWMRGAGRAARSAIGRCRGGVCDG